MHRVVVTGVGAVSPCGLETETTWQSIVAGKTGIHRITGFDASSFPSQIAGECVGFDPSKYVEKKRLREGSRFIHLALAASEMAVESSGFEPTDEERERVGTFVGVGMCGLDVLEVTARTLFDRGPRKITPYFIPAVIANLTSGQVSMRWGFRGPSLTTTSACSSGAHAIGEAFEWIRHGRSLAALAGGAEAAVTGLGVGGFTAMRALSTRNDEPEKASRPFDKGRDGFIIAEGAGMLLLEEREHALRRGAPILAEVLGYGATADAYHLTKPAPLGEGAQRSMRAALQDAKLAPADLQYINAHGTSTPLGDAQELQAVKAVFGQHACGGLLISSTKSMTGHLLGAAGGLEAVITVLAIRDGVAPPTLNLDDPDPACEGLDLVAHESRRSKIRVAMSNSFGFGGTNVSLAFGSPK